MKTVRRFVILSFLTLALTGGNAVAQDLSKLVTKADVEKAAGAKFKDGWKPMPTQMSFAQEGGDLQISVEVEPRETTSTVRGWEATIKRMQPGTKVDTVADIGKDAIYYSTRADSGSLSADFDKPLVQIRVAIAGAKSPAQAKEIVVSLARIVGPRVGK